MFLDKQLGSSLALLLLWAYLKSCYCTEVLNIFRNSSAG